MVAALDSALDTWSRTPGHHGVSAAVILADRTTWSAAKGLAGPTEPLQRAHLLSVGSITKTMTAAVILQMVAEGRLSLDDSLGGFLPQRPHVDSAITIRQLLNHTNGLSNYTTSSGLSQAIASDPNHRFSADELLSFVGPPQFAPGSNTAYTNTSFLLLGLVAEQISGMNIDALFRERLWNRVGLMSAWLPGYGGAPGPIADAVASFGLVAPADHMALLSAGHSAFGVMATAEDVARWGHELFTGQVVTAAMQSEMRRMVPAAGNIPGESGSGLGIRGYNYFGRSQIGHSGATPFGNSLLLHDSSAGITVVVMMNQASGADHFVLAPTLLSIALGRQ